MLRREAEQLQRQMEEMAKNGQQNGQSSSAASSSSPAQGNSQQQRSSGQNGAQGQAGSQSSELQAQNQSDQRVQQALRRLQDATDAMKRSSGPQQNPDAARQAADQLRQAENLLAGTQQQLASGKLDSLAREAGRLKDEERAQSERIDKLANQQEQQSDRPDQHDGANPRARPAGAGAAATLRRSVEAARNMRDGAREMAPNQPEVARQLRDALTEMDNSDLDNHAQRTADWLRRGINPNANGTEDQIAQGLDKLKQQLQQAQHAMGRQQGGGRESGREGGQADQNAALDTIQRLRNQIESMTHAPGGNGTAGQDQSNAQRGSQQPGDNNARNGNGRAGNGQQQARNGQWNPQPLQGRGGQAGSSSDRRGGNGTRASGDVGGEAGDTRTGDARGAEGTVWGNINTGNNTYGAPGQPHADTPFGNPADTERVFQQELHELNQLRQMVKGDPEAAKEAEDLARQMQRLDPKRFPGNPEIVEQMHRDLLGSIDRLELQVERSGLGSLESRIGKPHDVPEGYQDAVAEYYRQLSKAQ